MLLEQKMIPEEKQPVKDWYPRDVPLPSNADVRLVEELFTPRMLHGLAHLCAGTDVTMGEMTTNPGRLAAPSGEMTIRGGHLVADTTPESGAYQPGVGAALALARELGDSVEALFGRPAEPSLLEADWAEAPEGASGFDAHRS